MNNVAMMKPVRVITELNPTQQFIRVVKRAMEIRDAAYARADAEFVERVQEGLPKPAAVETPTDTPATG